MGNLCGQLYKTHITAVLLFLFRHSLLNFLRGDEFTINEEQWI